MPQVGKCPLLIFINKSNQENAATPGEIKIALKLETIMNHSIHILTINALTGEGIREGMNWLSKKSFD